MASVQHLIDSADCVIGEILSRRGDYQTIEQDRHFAALIIQKVFRGYMVRKMIKLWNYAATEIQRWVRGWLVRWHLPEILRKYLEKIRWDFYNRQSTKIQAAWRGYSVRKRINIKAIIQKRKEMQAMNDETKETLKQAFENLREQKRMQDYENKKKQTIYALQNMHHLIRTEDIEGVFSLHGKREFSDIEKLIIYLSKQNYIKVERDPSVEKVFIDDSSVCPVLNKMLNDK